MKTQSTIKIIIIIFIILFDSLSTQEVKGQSTLQKLKNKIAQGLYNKTHPKSDSSASSTNNQKNISDSQQKSPAYTNTNSPVSVADTRKRRKTGEKNFISQPP